MESGLRHDLVVTGGYWAFTLTDGAIRMLVVLYFHSLGYSPFEVGFYYMANAAGRLTGTVLSGLVYQQQGLVGCLWWSTSFVLVAGLLSLRLPRAAG